MIIVGCDYHPASNKLLLWIPTLGNCNSGGWSILRWRKFCRNLATNGMKVGVGMEARGQARWFARLLAELNIELWIGDAAEIRANRVRKQKTDRQDAHWIDWTRRSPN